MPFISDFDLSRPHAFRKETSGVVIQFFNEKGKMTFQRFEAGDECHYFDNKGNAIDPPANEQYPGFDLVDGTPEIDE